MIPPSAPTPSVQYLVQLVVRYLALRSRSRSEIIRYLNRKAGPANQSLITIVMDKIDHFNILNDAHFAEEFAKAQLHRGKGPRYISYALKQKGLDSDLIKHALATLDPDMITQSAQRALAKILPTWLPLNPFRLRAKATRYLYSRGFNQSSLEAVIDDHLLYKVK